MVLLIKCTNLLLARALKKKRAKHAQDLEFTFNLLVMSVFRLLYIGFHYKNLTPQASQSLCELSL